MKFFKHLSTIILCLGLLLGSFTTAKVLAEEGEGGEVEIPAEEGTKPTYDVSGSKTASPVELDSNHRNTTVTLTLPSGEYHYTYDIVFVMDSSSSTTNNNVDFSIYCKDLFDALIEKDATLKIGVIQCRGVAFDTIELASKGQYKGLVEYNEDNAQIITGTNDKDNPALPVTIGAINYPGNVVIKSSDSAATKELKNAIKKVLTEQGYESALDEISSGTNMHGGLDLANDWLEADQDVPNDRKFVIFLIDGKTYIWNNEADEPTSVYTQYMASSKAYGTPTIGQATGSYAKAAYKHKDKYFYDFTVTDEEVSDMSKCFYTQDYEKIYNSDHADLASTETKYDFFCYYAINKGAANGTRSATANGNLNVRNVTNGGQFTYVIHKNFYDFTPANIPASENTPAIDWESLNYLQANPYVIIENDDGTYTYDLETPNPDFYQVHPDSLQKALYLTGHLWTDMKEKYNTAALVYSGWGTGSGLAVAKSFDSWIKQKEISDYAAEITETEELKAVFDSIKEDILYMIDRGVVTDTIPEEFSLVIPETGFPVRVSLSSAKITSAKDPEKENTWNFGAPIVVEGPDGKEETYEYVVTVDGKNIIWKINVPVKNSDPVSLTYELEIAKDAEPGYHDTNVSAVLEFEPTTPRPDITDKTYEFEVPRIIYNPLVDITVTKVWEDEDHVALKGYERPEEVTVRLLADNKADIPMGVEGTEWPYEYDKPADVKLNEDNELTYTFLNLNRYKIVASEDSDELVITEINYSAEEDEVAGFETGTGRVVFENKIAENAVKLTGSVEITNTPVDGEKVFNPIELTVKKLGKSVLNEEEIILKGTEFKLESEVLKEPQTFTTGEDGTFKITFEVPGTYTLTETKAPVGYEIDGEGVYKIVVTEVGLVELVLNEETGVWDKVCDIAFDEATLKLLDKEGKELDVYNNQIVKELKISKTWNDNDDMFGCRPESVEVSILAGKETYDKVVLDEKGEWKATVTVPVYDKDGKEVTYSVEEKLPAGYTVEYVSEKDVFEIINTFETTDITIIKTWEDNNNAEDARPEALIINVLAGEDTVAVVKLSEESQWQYTITMPKYDEKGNEVKYTVEEEVPEGYTAEYSVEGNVFTILNTRTPDTGDNSGVILYGSMLVFSGAMFIVLAIILKKRYSYNR